jgi:serpin B
MKEKRTIIREVHMKKLLCLLLVIPFMAAFAGCSTGSYFDRTNSDTQNTPGQNGRNVSDSISQDLGKANMQFAFDIFRQLNKEDEGKNIFISPLSISTALTMAYQGAEASTKTAMAETLGYSGIGMDELNRSYRRLLDHLSKTDKEVELNISNSIWIKDGVPVNEAFLKTNKDIFGAKAAVLDFAGEKAADTINGWISRSTKGKIEKMIDPPIDPYVFMYLINAIYFKGQWTEKFNTKNTFDAVFHNEDGTKSDIMMMSRNGKAEYASGDNYKAVRLPYGKGKTAMYIILPDEGMDTDEFIESMQPDFWDTLKVNLDETDNVILQIPRFKLEYGVKELKESLSALGMGEAFSDSADFSGIRKDTFISRVLHKAVIEVNEEGSTAAGVTAVEMRTTSAAIPVSFIADRPFIFIIADDITNTILFIGKLAAA